MTITQWSLVFFTVFLEFATGIALFLLYKERHDAKPDTANAWLAATGCSAVALVGGICGGLLQGFLFAAQVCSLVLPFALFGAYKKIKFCNLLAATVGLVGVLCQAVAAIPGEVFTVSGLFPPVLFTLCTIIFGAVFCQLTQMGEAADPSAAGYKYGRFSLVLRICLWIMLTITALIPCIEWSDQFMAKSAFYWMQTQFYWMGVIFSGVVIGLSHMGRVTLVIQAVVAFLSMAGLRTAFYADNVHGVLDMSTLYMK